MNGKDYAILLNPNQAEQLNIVLIGMPGCGKSSTGAELARITGLPCFDTDEMVIELAGISIEDIFSRYGEAAFRRLEQQATMRAAASRGSIIATGGGTVLKEENCRALAQNGRFFFIERALHLLPINGRPLSVDLQTMYAQRLPIYQRLAHATIDNNDTITQAAMRVLQAHKKI